MKKNYILVLLCCLMISCIVPPSIRYKSRVFKTETDLTERHWVIDFEYEFAASDANSEERKAYAIHLKLLEDIYYQLKERGLKISKISQNDSPNSPNRITLHVVSSVVNSLYANADINIYSKNEILARISIDNQHKGGYDAPVTNNKFAKYCVNRIMNVLVGQQKQKKKKKLNRKERATGPYGSAK